VNNNKISGDGEEGKEGEERGVDSQITFKLLLKRRYAFLQHNKDLIKSKRYALNILRLKVMAENTYSLTPDTASAAVLTHSS
jgi:hypothetical protein